MSDFRFIVNQGADGLTIHLAAEQAREIAGLLLKQAERGDSCIMQMYGTLETRDFESDFDFVKRQVEEDSDP